MTDDIREEATSDLIAKRAKGLSLIESFESRLRALLNSFEETTEEIPDSPFPLTEEEESDRAKYTDRVRDHLNDEMEDLRNDLFEGLKGHFSPTGRDAPAKSYEQVVYSLISDRMRRYFGYNSAINRCKEEARQLNNQVGDQVFDVDGKEVTKLLQSIDEIYFVKYLCVGIGLTPSDTEKIVNHQIDREFKTRSK